MAFKYLIKKVKGPQTYWSVWILNENGIYFWGPYDSYRSAVDSISNRDNAHTAEILDSTYWNLESIKRRNNNPNYITSFIPTKESF